MTEPRTYYADEPAPLVSNEQSAIEMRLKVDGAALANGTVVRAAVMEDAPDGAQIIGETTATQRAAPDDEWWDVVFTSAQCASLVGHNVARLQIHLGAPYKRVLFASGLPVDHGVTTPAP